MSITIKKEELMNNAGNNFKVGLNCIECVLKAYLDMEDATFPAEVIALATGMGGGIGHTKEGSCGALLGACMAVGCVKGRKNPLERETRDDRIAQLRQEIYPTYAKLTEQFKEEFKSINCGEMCRMFEDIDGIDRLRNCKKAIEFAAGMVADEVYK